MLSLQTHDLYPETNVDVKVSSGNDRVSKNDTSTSRQKEPVGNDADGGGVSSADLIAPSPISSNVP
jgi:hypothetical protein